MVIISFVTWRSLMRRVMWEWNVRALDFDAQVEATALAGFDVITLPYRRYLEQRAAGRKAEELVRVAEANGVTIDFLDGMSGWSPVRYPPSADTFLRDALDFGPDEALELCMRGGIRNIVAIAGFERAALPVSSLIDSFGAFCERAASAGIDVHLEAMPMMGLPTLADVWAVVDGAKCANSGILFDTWHFMRGGADLELLQAIPRGAIRHVQIVDGRATAPSGDLWDDAMHHREFPGRGEMPLLGILKILRDTQDLDSVGPEALSDRVDLLTPAELASEARQSLDAILSAAGFNLTPPSEETIAAKDEAS
jgi:sugar phosphate isomerase/epimerase